MGCWAAAAAVNVEAEIEELLKSEELQKSLNLPRLNGVGCPTVLPTDEGTGELVESDPAPYLLLSPNEFCPSCRPPAPPSVVGTPAAPAPAPPN